MTYPSIVLGGHADVLTKHDDRSVAGPLLQDSAIFPPVVSACQRRSRCHGYQAIGCSIQDHAGAGFWPSGLICWSGDGADLLSLPGETLY